MILVAGAGRGPLVHAALNASHSARVCVRVYAIEKNPSCVLRLARMGAQDSYWRKCVTVVASDMREWRPEFKGDIIVSELLGSFR